MSIQSAVNSQCEGTACVIHSDHPLAFRTIENIVSSHSDLCGCTRRYSKGIKPQKEHKSEILLLDTCSVEHWQESLQHWHAEGGRTIVLISPETHTEWEELELLYLGAMGIVRFSDDQILSLHSVIQAVVQGRLWMRRAVLNEYVRRTNLLLRRLFFLDRRFTAREREIADCLRKGCTNRQIADLLGISERTAKFHVSNLLRKCGIGNRRELSATDCKLQVLPPIQHLGKNGSHISPLDVETLSVGAKRRF